MNAHGYRRVTTDVDVLLTQEGLAQLEDKHLGRGWVERFAGAPAPMLRRLSDRQTLSP